MYPVIFGKAAKLRPGWPRALILTLAVAAALVSTTADYGILLAQDLTAEKQKLALEIEKLALEIEKLRADPGAWESTWFPLIEALVLPASLALLAWYLKRVEDRRADKAKSEADAASRRFNALVEARAQAYAKAFAILKPTALYFPETSRTKEERVITRQTCARMGRDLSDWYFGAGGVLMSKETRDAYFDLMSYLGRAADSKLELLSQTFEEHGSSMSQIDEYRAGNDIPKLDTWRLEGWSHEDWKFGESGSEASRCADRYKDFVFIQALASRFRSKLTSDIESRLPPGGQAA